MVCTDKNEAQIDGIEPYGKEWKYKLILKTSAKEIEKLIPNGDSLQDLMQGPIYTKFSEYFTEISIIA